MQRAGVAAVLMLVTPGVLHAQSRPPQVRGSGGLGIFAEAEEHSLATVGWRKYVGARGWGFEIEGLVMRGDDHHEAAFAVDVVKDLAPPDSGTVPYLTMRAFIVGGSNRGSTTSSGERAWGWGAGLAPELGFGITEWSAGRRFFIAPEVRVGFFPNIRLSVAVGFTL